VRIYRSLYSRYTVGCADSIDGPKPHECSLLERRLQVKRGVHQRPTLQGTVRSKAVGYVSQRNPAAVAAAVGRCHQLIFGVPEIVCRTVIAECAGEAFREWLATVVLPAIYCEVMLVCGSITIITAIEVRLNTLLVARLPLLLR
jgi:hypothetical protein